MAAHPTKTSKAGLAAIVKREGVRLNAYRDSVGVPTIGVGHTKGVRMGQKISLAQAYRFLRADVAEVERVVRRFRVPAQRMFDALVSFGFNLGVGYFFKGHTMGDALAVRHWDKAAAAFDVYHTPPEIIGRRNSEKAQYLRGLRAYKKRAHIK